jgi:hypothetical protein
LTLPTVGSSAKAASELEAEVNISEKLGAGGTAGGVNGGKPAISLKMAVMDAVLIKSPADRRNWPDRLSAGLTANPMPARGMPLSRWQN